MKPIAALPYLAATVAGMLAALIAPPWLLLPLFFTLLGFVAASLVISHTVPNPTYARKSATVIAAVLAVLVGGAGTAIRTGATSRWLLFGLLAGVGFVSALVYVSVRVAA